MYSNIEFYCSYPLCMALRKDGYNRWGDSYYTYAHMYNGKEIDFEKELDLKFEGKAKLIKRIPGKSICDHNATNQELESYGDKKSCVRVSQACAMEWMRKKHKVHVAVDRVDGKGKNIWYAELVDLKSPTRKVIAITPKVDSYEMAVEKAMMKYYKVRAPRKK